MSRIILVYCAEQLLELLCHIYAKQKKLCWEALGLYFGVTKMCPDL